MLFMAKFMPGASGNPRGRPRGSQNKMTVIFKEVIGQDAKDMAEVLKRKAMGGDMRALQLIVDRIFPAPKDAPSEISEALPNVTTPAEALEFLGVVMRSVGRGEISPSQAKDLTQVVSIFIAALEVVDLAKRVEAIELAQDEIASQLDGRRHET